MILGPSWYRRAEAVLAPSWPLLYAASAVIVGVTVWLVVMGQALPLAVWLTYLFMP